MARIIALSIVPLVLLGACVSVLPEQAVPNALYRLDSVEPVAALAADVVIREPTALRVMGGQGMVAQRADGGLQLITGAEWAGRLPRLMQAGLMDALRVEGAGTPVTSISGATVQYEVLWDINDMTLVTGTGGDMASCVMDVTVLDGRTREPVASRRIRQLREAGGTSPSLRAQALSGVAHECVNVAAEFIASQIDQHYSPEAIAR